MMVNAASGLSDEMAVSKAKGVADRVLAPAAAANDKAGCFSTEAVKALGEAGLLGLTLPSDFGGSALGPRSLAAVTATLAQADASVAMVYLMHLCATATSVAARPSSVTSNALRDIGVGRHLSTLAFKRDRITESFLGAGSRARRNGAGVRISARKSWVTSAGYAQSYVVSTLSPTRKRQPAQLATMQIETDGLAARVDDLVDHLEHPRDTTLLRVLETKAAAGDAAISVTSAAMRACGGAAFSKHTGIERLFRDAHAGAGHGANRRCAPRIHREGCPWNSTFLIALA
jgi:alkylation response protein AidB-like acyl-CoA dehydrogenase